MCLAAVAFRLIRIVGLFDCYSQTPDTHDQSELSFVTSETNDYLAQADSKRRKLLSIEHCSKKIHRNLPWKDPILECVIFKAAERSLSKSHKVTTSNFIVRMFSPPAARHVPKPVQTASRRAETTNGDDVVLVNRHKSKFII